MAKITILNQSAPSTPSSGYSVLWIDSTTKKLVQTDDSGVHRAGAISKNYLTSQLTGFAADTYITGTSIQIPSFGMQVGQYYQWHIWAEKSAAGTGAITMTVRIGTGQSTSDTSRAALTATIAQTATASVVLMTVGVLVRTVSASGVIVAGYAVSSTTGGGGSPAATGWGDGDRVVSSTFDNTALAGQYIGLSLNGNTSAAYTIDSAVGWLIS